MSGVFPRHTPPPPHPTPSSFPDLVLPLNLALLSTLWIQPFHAAKSIRPGDAGPVPILHCLKARCGRDAHFVGCSSSLQIFMHKSAMQMHAREVAHRTEVKPHQCQQCLKSFSSNHQLVQHIRVHTGEKPYKCSYCDRRFKQLSHVQQHTRLHTANESVDGFHKDCASEWKINKYALEAGENRDAEIVLINFKQRVDWLMATSATFPTRERPRVSAPGIKALRRRGVRALPTWTLWPLANDSYLWAIYIVSHKASLSPLL
ncbi:hypothetical protein PR048_011612 [Dryococelus australis]|uniref:C2H2-type domain-containing protein n=1 Tax=Dryococelus australis TaxID=614101 RepID=A0ABQ9HMK8_9NEOP|nr:hypothetical protein PR048_011612 [Dryococelus australis]